MKLNFVPINYMALLRKIVVVNCFYLNKKGGAQ